MIRYSPKYPDELPEISLEVVEGTLSAEEEEELVMGLIGQVRFKSGVPSSGEIVLTLDPHFLVGVSYRRTIPWGW